MANEQLSLYKLDVETDWARAVVATNHGTHDNSASTISGYFLILWNERPIVEMQAAPSRMLGLLANSAMPSCMEMPMTERESSIANMVRMTRSRRETVIFFLMWKKPSRNVVTAIIMDTALTTY